MEHIDLKLFLTKGTISTKENKVKTGYVKRMCAVYYKRLLFSEIAISQLDRHQRSQRMWKMIITFVAAFFEQTCLTKWT